MLLSVPPRVRPALRLLAVTAGAGLIGCLIWRAGPANLWQELVKLGWGFALVIALSGVAHLVKTWAWQLTLGKERNKVSFLRLTALRLGAEAAGQLGIVGQTFGDSVRVAQLRDEISKANCVASVTLDRGLYLVTGTIVAIAGILAALPALSHSHALRFYAELFIVGAIVFLIFTLLAVRKRWPLMSGSARLIGRVSRLKKGIEQRLHLVQSIEDALFDFHHETPMLFWVSFALNVVGQCLAILEVCVVLWLLGAHVGFFGALIIEGLTKLLNIIGNLNPGNIGSYEGGNVLIGKIFSLSSATGLALAFARRMRALIWTAVGVICLVALTKSSKAKYSGAATREKTTSATKVKANISNSVPSSGVAFIVFLPSEDTWHGVARVGALPIPLRTMLVAQRLNAAQIIVVADSATRQSAQREFACTGRLPEFVEWLGMDAEASLRNRLHSVVGVLSSEHIVLVDGSTTYHTCLLRQASEWNDQDAGLALTSNGVSAGLYSLPARALREIAEHCPEEARDLAELLPQIPAVHAITSSNVSEELWQRVRSEGERRIAEKKLDRWLVKPTDGMYAQFNRRISIPISRQLIKFPVTANMVSFFTLAVGIASAAFFALGGYWYTLAGALLCLFASILDGCDGEVARLKLLESDFGCWLETICDYLFYFFLLAGMSIGQWRSSGSREFLVAGGFLLLGALASFLAVGWQRRRLATGQPEQLLGIWHSHAQSRSSNPLMYAARHMEFIVRRCFFPYALVAFALLGIMKVAFMLSVLGANLVWPIALYSLWTFSGTKPAVSTLQRAQASH
jgi:phosphatidylglycerophosphate synthase